MKGGTLIDGTGAPPRKADLLMGWGRILASGNLAAESAHHVFDARDQVVCPGFIDVHVHSDLSLLADPNHVSGVSQGITTEVLGQDGLAYAPLSPENLSEYKLYLGGLNGNPSLDLTWSSVREFRELFNGKTAVNTIYQVPHGALRLETVGWADVPLRGANLQKAQRLLAQGFQEGAQAFSTGLSYYPCSFSDTEELIELCKVAAAYGKPYVVHLRTVFPKKPFDPVQEAIEIAEKSGAPLHISHFRTTPETAGQVGKVLEHIEGAIARGVDITLDTYPYPAGAGFLMVMLPRWVHTNGYKGVLARLANPHTRIKIIEDMVSLDLVHDGIISYLPNGADKHLVGQSLSKLAREWDLDLPALICELLFRNQLQVGYMSVPPEQETWVQIEKDIRELIKKPYYMVGSDSIASAQFSHPRTRGCYPKFLRWQRKYKFMPLEDLIQRMTSLPAKRFGLTDRGILKKGMAADVVVFDPQQIGELASYTNPNLIAEGITYVFVNGNLTFSQGQSLGIMRGIALP